MHVLIAYGSKRGGTRGIAEMLGEDLRHEGLDSTVRPAAEVTTLAGYDAVVVGGALYNNGWHKDARRFVKRLRAGLQDRPVWLFSSGPLDDTALGGDIPPVRQVTKATELVDARGHETFGGRLADDATGFPASSMAKTMAGDWRDPDQVSGWAKRIAEELRIG